MQPTIQHLCEAASEQLARMAYLEAESTLLQAEAMALEQSDWDTLARLYMPLQEARRQRRQRCGEGVVKLDLLASGPDDLLDAESLASRYSHGQLLIAGWGTIEPALSFRSAASHRRLYAETFLGAVYPITGGGRAVVVVASVEVALPPADEMPIDRLIRIAPPHSIVMPATELPLGDRIGDTQTYAQTMRIWERLHLPFLAAADHTTDPRLRIDAYRKTIAVDYACELAHQKLADTARTMLKQTYST